MKRHVHRIGDKVEVVTPIFVTRVGYPFSYHMAVQELERNSPAVEEAMIALGLTFTPSKPGHYPLVYSGHRKHFISRVASSLVHHRNHGGSERRIHTMELPNRVGLEAVVIGKRVVRTGDYYSPSGGYDSYTGECDYEPGGLSNAKSHVLLELAAYGPEDYGRKYLEIEACHVKPAGAA